jgi:hypothetical protein
MTIGRAAVLAMVALVTLPARLHAGPLILLNAQYGAPMRASAGIGVLSSFDRRKKSRSVEERQVRSGLLVAGNVGKGGEQLAVGIGGLVTEGSYLLIYGFDIRGTVTRTGTSPRQAAAESTYGGVEAGLTLSLVRLSAGYARRLSGAAATRRHALTWSVGVQLPLGW